MKSGTVAVIGRANAGKSTLINVLVGEKVSIVSPRPQTTRDRIMGILNDSDCQIAFVDTPGLYKADNMLNSVMQKTTQDTAKETDAILLCVDVHDGITDKEVSLCRQYAGGEIPLIVALTKIDIVSEKLLIQGIKTLSELGVEIVPVSARKGKNLKELLSVLKKNLPEGERLFDENIISDRSQKFMVGEIIREKILLKFSQEIPHGVVVIINKFELSNNKQFYDINVDIVCEKPNHKAILIGKGGKAIKEFSTFARQDLEKFLEKKVFLTTYVKVKEDWRNSAYLIKELGYGADDVQ